MRKTFIDTLTQLARQDTQIMLLTGDLGFSVFEDFAKEFPGRFINCGVMEQSMLSIAAGLALEGKKPYVYSIIPFATMRPFEQIRNDICYQNLNVKIVGVGAGFAYGAFGSTHYAIEDISILRPLPNITVISPADSIQTRELTLQSYKKPGPCYLRLLKPEVVLMPAKVKTILGKPSVIRNGNDGAIITTGACLQTGLAVADTMKESKKHLTVISLHTLSQINEPALVKAIKGQKHIFTIEEHRTIGGLGSLIAEQLLKHRLGGKLTTLGIDDSYQKITGHQQYLAERHGLGKATIYKKILKELKK